MDHLLQFREMLSEYYSIDLDESGGLTSIPFLIPGYIPELDQLPLLLQWMLDGKRVDWTEEKTCIDGIARALARFYSPVPDVADTSGGGDGDENIVHVSAEYEAKVREVVLPAWKQQRWQVPASVETDGTIRRLTTTHDLYRVFERC